MTAPRPIQLALPDELLGPRVCLRPYTEADAPALWEAIDESRDYLAPWLPWVNDYVGPESAVVATREIRAKWLLRQDLIVGIFARSTGQLLGGSGLSRIDWAARRFEIGYWLRQSAAGQGYAAEAVQVLTRFAFDQLDANRLEIRMDVRNLRSRAVPERLGFHYDGCLRRWQPDRDMLVYSVIREDYDQLAWAHEA